MTLTARSHTAGTVTGDRGPVAAQLGAWVAGTQYDQLPDAVRVKTRNSIVDTVGVALAGAHHPAVAAIIRGLEELGGRPQADVIGLALRTSADHAALANAYAAHILDFDDTLHIGGITHVSAPVLAAALAAAQAAHATGPDLLAAHAVGMEVAARLTRAMSNRPEHGWHLTGIAGAFGAAAAAARAARLSTEHTIDALGAVSTLASGLRVHRGTTTKALSPGHAAANGVLAAVMSRIGVSSNTAFFEHPRHGFLVTHGFSTEPRVVVDNLGVEFTMLGVEPKLYPCGITAHPVIDTAMDLLENEAAGRITSADVDRITMVVHPLALELTGIAHPVSGLESKFSVTHAAATALVDGRVTLASFTDHAVRRPEIMALRQLVSVTADAAMNQYEAAISITTKSGRTASAASTARGSRDRPINPADIDWKFLQLNELFIGADRARLVMRRIDELKDAGSLDPFSQVVSPRSTRHQEKSAPVT